MCVSFVCQPLRKDLLDCYPTIDEAFSADFTHRRRLDNLHDSQGVYALQIHLKVVSEVLHTSIGADGIGGVWVISIAVEELGQVGLGRGPGS